jgi:hypothetical protein
MEVIPGCLHKDSQSDSLHLEPQHQEVEKAIMMFQQWLQLELTKPLLQLAPLSIQAMFIAWLVYMNWNLITHKLAISSPGDIKDTGPNENTSHSRSSRTHENMSTLKTLRLFNRLENQQARGL